MERILRKQSLRIEPEELIEQAAGYEEVLLDLGTGDGRYVVSAARHTPALLAIGLDACREGLVDVSRRAPANALFVRENALSLPPGLSRLATRVTLNFPWGSLLHALIEGDPVLMERLAAMGRPGAALEIRLNGGALSAAGWSLEDAVERLWPALHAGGLRVMAMSYLDALALRRMPSTWAKRLAFGRDPRALEVTASWPGVRVEAPADEGCVAAR